MKLFLICLFAAPIAMLRAQPADLAARIAAHRNSTILIDHETVTFYSGSNRLVGFVFKPIGSGPFPAIIWNHGSERMPEPPLELAAFYTSHGFVFFVPLRHGHGSSPGPYIADVFAAYTRAHPNAADRNREAVSLNESYSADLVAAAAWLKFQPYVSPQRIVMSGLGDGAVQTLMAAEKPTGIKGCIPFGVGAGVWSNPELHKRLADAVRDARAPIFLLQAKNDYSTGPSDVLGPLILHRGNPNQARLYPAFGTTNQQGHTAFATWDLGTDVWGPDVLAFLANVLK